MDPHAAWYVIAAAMVLLGLIGIVLPALPGVPLIFAGMVLAAAADGFERVQWWWIAILGVLTLLSVGIDFWATAIGQKGKWREASVSSDHSQARHWANSGMAAASIRSASDRRRRSVSAHGWALRSASR